MSCVLKRKASIGLPLLLTAVVLCSSCSAFTDFVVVNESNYPVEVKYKVKKSTAGRLATSGLPATIEVSRLSTYGGVQWKQLDTSQYQLIDDPEVDIVVVRLMSKEVLRLTTVRSYEEDETCDIGQSFPITDIQIPGPNGKLELTGDRVRTNFSKVSRALCVITYK